MNDDHTIALASGQVSVWRDALLRATGFPAAGLTRLSAPICERAADALIANPLIEDGTALVAAFADAFAAAARDNSAAIYDIARDRLFREAVTWQNRSALMTVEQIIAAGPDPHRSSRHRQRERMVARYWQRYCGKTDTIGFFGPVCWAAVDPNELGVSLTAGPGLIRNRTVYLEYWALAALADRLAAEPGIRVWLAPALSPQLTLRGRDLLDPVRPATRLTAAQAAVLVRCDGRRPAWQVADEVTGAGNGGPPHPADVYLLLEQLAARGVVRWDFDLPVSLAAERVFRDKIALIADRDLRAMAQTKLAALSDRRDEVAAAAGDPARLGSALARLDSAFAELTGQEPTRRPGQMYAGRTACLEETTRDLDVMIGAAVLDAIAGPLTVPLVAARWLCCALAEKYLAELSRLHTELAADLGTAEVPLGVLWFLAQDAFYGGDSRPCAAVNAEFTRRWARLFELDRAKPTERELSFTATDLATPLDELFPAGNHAWAAARIHSPDVQFRAKSVEAFGRGEFTAVLSEMHVAWATAGCAAAVAGHADPGRLRRAFRRDMGRGSLHPLLPPDWPRHTPRLAFALDDSEDSQLGFTAAPGADPERLIPISSIAVRREGSGLRAVAADGRSWPLLEVFARPLSETAVEAFKLAGQRPHVPRLTVGRLTVARESWQLRAAGCPVLSASGERDQYLAARRWRADLGLPDYVFVKTVAEVKPIFIDMTSPVSVSVLAATLRAARAARGERASFVVTEMLPEPGEMWVCDAAGQRYAAELRLHIRNDLFQDDL